MHCEGPLDCTGPPASSYLDHARIRLHSPSYGFVHICEQVALNQDFRFVMLSLYNEPALTTTLSAPVALTNVENLEITTTVTNTGDETLKLLKDPRGALSSWATQTFTVANEHGASPEFNGVAVRYVPEAIAKSTEADHFVVLTPGASISVEHEGKLDVSLN